MKIQDKQNIGATRVKVRRGETIAKICVDAVLSLTIRNSSSAIVLLQGRYDSNLCNSLSKMKETERKVRSDINSAIKLTFRILGVLLHRVLPRS